MADNEDELVDYDEEEVRHCSWLYFVADPYMLIMMAGSSFWLRYPVIASHTSHFGTGFNTYWVRLFLRCFLLCLTNAVSRNATVFNRRSQMSQQTKQQLATPRIPKSEFTSFEKSQR